MIFRFIVFSNKTMTNFLEAYSSGDSELVKTMSSLIHNWNWGFINACSHRHLNIIKLMLEQRSEKGRSSSSAKPAIDWNWVMLNACKSGNMSFIKLMIVYAERSGEKSDYPFDWNLDTNNWNLDKYKFVSSLSLLELKRFSRMRIVPLDMKKMIQKRLYFFFHIHANPLFYENMFPVLFFKK